MNLLIGFLSFGGLSLAPWMIAIIVPIAGLIFAGAITITAIYTKHQKQMAWHQTARIALEKGQPIPPQPLSDEELKEGMPPPHVNLVEWDRIRQAQQRRNDVRNGLILIAVGAGLFVMLDHISGSDLGFVGAIPAFIGLAMLLHGLLAGVFGGKH